MEETRESQEEEKVPTVDQARKMPEEANDNILSSNKESMAFGEAAGNSSPDEYDEEQGGSVIRDEEQKTPKPKKEGSDYDMFNNLDQNINDYQITKDDQGTINVKIATVYRKHNAHNMKSGVFGQSITKSVSGESGAFGSEPRQKSKSLAEHIEEVNEAKIQVIEENVKQVFGKKFDFEVTIDETQRSGLRGLPPDVESRILAVFKKEEIMADPEKVIQCIIEAQVITGEEQYNQMADENSVKRRQKYDLPIDAQVS